MVLPLRNTVQCFRKRAIPECVSLTDRDLALRRAIFTAFAETGAAPELHDAAGLRRLADAHVIVLGEHGEIRAAHPFAAHHEGARVQAQGRTWWGNCAWDALGIAAALGLDDATITAQGLTLEEAAGFHVLVPAAHWWDDIAFT
jgi:Alkylmercury lyase